MKIITHEAIKGLIRPEEAFELVKENFVRKNEWGLPAKTSLKCEASDFFNIMPCMMPAEGFAGGARKNSVVQCRNSDTCFEIYNRISNRCADFDLKGSADKFFY